MSRRSHFVLWISAVILTGCAGFGQVSHVSDLSVEQLRQMRNIQVHESEKDLKYKSLGQIKGISCKGSAWSGNTMQEAAMTQLKIKATKINANM